MNCSAAILSQWRREDPDRLLQAALSQAERLDEMAPEVEALRAENASLYQQLEVTTKRIAQLEEALEAALRAAHRQAAPFPYRATKTRGGAQAAGAQARTSGRLPAQARSS
jgi:capsule polysaccharide export protein KpsE/RkpR